MALERILVGDILHVAESIFSFHDTKSTYWQYDVKRWLRSRTGRAGDPPTDPMDEASIKWCKEVHLPKAVRQDAPPYWVAERRAAKRGAGAVHHPR